MTTGTGSPFRCSTSGLGSRCNDRPITRQHLMIAPWAALTLLLAYAFFQVAPHEVRRCRRCRRAGQCRLQLGSMWEQEQRCHHQTARCDPDEKQAGRNRPVACLVQRLDYSLRPVTHAETPGDYHPLSNHHALCLQQEVEHGVVIAAASAHWDNRGEHRYARTVRQAAALPNTRPSPGPHPPTLGRVFSIPWAPSRRPQRRTA